MGPLRGCQRKREARIVAPKVVCGVLSTLTSEFWLFFGLLQWIVSSPASIGPFHYIDSHVTEPMVALNKGKRHVITRDMPHHVDFLCLDGYSPEKWTPKRPFQRILPAGKSPVPLATHSVTFIWHYKSEMAIQKTLRREKWRKMGRFWMFSRPESWQPSESNEHGRIHMVDEAIGTFLSIQCGQVG